MPTSNFLEIHFNIILPSTPGSSKWFLSPSGFPTKILYAPVKTLLMVYQRMSPIPRQMGAFHNMEICYGEEPSAPLQTRTPKNHPLSVVRDCLFNIFAVTLHIGGRSSIRNLRTRHAVVTGIHFTCMKTFLIIMRGFSVLFLSCERNARV